MYNDGDWGKEVNNRMPEDLVWSRIEARVGPPAATPLAPQLRSPGGKCQGRYEELSPVLGGCSGDGPMQNENQGGN